MIKFFFYKHVDFYRLPQDKISHIYVSHILLSMYKYDTEVSRCLIIFFFFENDNLKKNYLEKLRL